MSEETKENEIEYIPEGDSVIEQILRATILGYKENYNNLPDQKNEVDFSLTITTHKVPTKDGNKDVAYLQVIKAVRPKDYKPTEIEDESEGWESKLVHQELYFFKKLQERLDPKAPWKEQLYINTLSRLVSAGLEYAELLQRLKNTKQTETLPEDETKVRAEKLGLVVEKKLPKPLSPQELEYKDWVTKERAKGL